MSEPQSWNEYMREIDWTLSAVRQKLDDLDLTMEDMPEIPDLDKAILLLEYIEDLNGSAETLVDLARELEYIAEEEELDEED